MGYETITFMTRCNSPSTKAPIGKTLIIGCTCLGNLIIGCDLHAMIPMTYEPLESVLVVAAGSCPVERTYLLLL